MWAYLLCGFLNFASVGIHTGGIGALVPCKHVLSSEFGIPALAAGTYTFFISATIISMILG